MSADAARALDRVLPPGGGVSERERRVRDAAREGIRRADPTWEEWVHDVAIATRRHDDEALASLMTAAHQRVRLAETLAAHPLPLDEEERYVTIDPETLRRNLSD